MIYASADFVFFVALVLLVFCLSPPRGKIYVLILASLFWYSIWSLSWLAIILAIILSNQAFFSLASRANARERNWLFPSLIAANSLVLIGLKIWPYWHPGGKTPYGTSFIMLMMIGLIFDRWRKVPEANGNTEATSLMLGFFPLVMGGPIERARHLVPQLSDLRFNLGNVRDGILIFSWGFSKLFFLGGPLSLAASELFKRNYMNIPLLLGVSLLGTIQAYLDFSSYCDMGRGAARCFGVKLGINFRPFYYSRNPLDFWQRWNISIATWMRDYFTMPLLLRFGRKISPNALVFCSFLLIGLWHGLRWNWLFFGIWNGAAVWAFVILQKKFNRSPGVVTFSGLCLVWLTYCVNGLLQRSELMMLLRNLRLSFSWPTALNLSEWSFSLLSLWPYIFGWLVVEFFQEKKKALDFYLEWPNWLKTASAFALVIGYLVILRLGWTSDVRLDLPAYFRF